MLPHNRGWRKLPPFPLRKHPAAHRVGLRGSGPCQHAVVNQAQQAANRCHTCWRRLDCSDGAGHTYPNGPVAAMRSHRHPTAPAVPSYRLASAPTWLCGRLASIHASRAAVFATACRRVCLVKHIAPGNGFPDCEDLATAGPPRLGMTEFWPLSRQSGNQPSQIRSPPAQMTPDHTQTPQQHTRWRALLPSLPAPKWSRPTSSTAPVRPPAQPLPQPAQSVSPR